MRYPALDVSGADGELLLAVVDDFGPTAVEEHSGGVVIYFTNAPARDAARDAIGRAFPSASTSPRDIDDEDWARRSQENLQPVTVGRITVAPPWAATRQPPAASNQLPASSLQLVILPSMGFGTGHHATTRLCLAALQTLDLRDKTVVDVGTGSGVLALAASLLGARQATGIDYDADAIRSAEENLALNPAIGGVRFECLDLRERELLTADIVIANLTGTLLVQNADRLRERLATGGVVVVSGLQTHERDEVVAAFGGSDLIWERAEEGWIGLAFNDRSSRAV